MPTTPTEILSRETIDALLKRSANAQRGEAHAEETEDELIAHLAAIEKPAVEQPVRDCLNAGNGVHSGNH